MTRLLATVLLLLIVAAPALAQRRAEIKAVDDMKDGRVRVLVTVTDADGALDISVILRAGEATEAKVAAEVRKRLSERAAALSALRPGAAVDLRAPAPAPTPTPDPAVVEREAFLEDYRKLERLERAVTLGTLSGTEPEVVALRQQVKDALAAHPEYQEHLP